MNIPSTQSAQSKNYIWFWSPFWDKGPIEPSKMFLNFIFTNTELQKLVCCKKVSLYRAVLQQCLDNKRQILRHLAQHQHLGKLNHSLERRSPRLVGLHLVLEVHQVRRHLGQLLHLLQVCISLAHFQDCILIFFVLVSKIVFRFLWSFVFCVVATPPCE